MPLCPACQEVIVRPDLAYAEVVYEHYNPHNEKPSLPFAHLTPGEAFNASDYIAFCTACLQHSECRNMVWQARHAMAEYLQRDF